MIEIRVAEMADYDLLLPFYKNAYRAGHPLLNADFYNWQFGDAACGRSIIAVENQLVVGHLGCLFADGFTWLTNLSLTENHRSGSLVLSMYSRAKAFGLPLATTNASAALVALYRRLRWYRQPNLERFCCINPRLAGAPVLQLMAPVSHRCGRLPTPAKHRYWQQPGLQGIALDNGSTAVLQPNCGGARLVDLKQPAETAAQLFECGYSWVDYVTSWNDPIIDQLQAPLWQPEKESIVPWYINPIILGSQSEITVFSNTPLPRDFIIKRYHSDHGRVPTL
ncbi:MAG: hypothetical protein EAY75_08240 [Bacteroidetes bacterium]|nr:MAG: hypothetical protein EAY75_08240 [Bacteroidota bacterium]